MSSVPTHHGMTAYLQLQCTLVYSSVNCLQVAYDKQHMYKDYLPLAG